MEKILIIDDEEIIRNSLRKLLNLDGYEVLVASNAQEGMDILLKYTVDDAEFIRVIILDVKMPGMTGIELLRKITNMKLLTEVIMMTGHGDIETAIQALKHGAFDYISKPMEYEELTLSIARAIDRQNIIISKNISERRLIDSEEKYRTLVERANDGIAIIQQEVFKYANQGLANILGYTIEEIMHTSINDYLSSKRKDDIDCISDENILIMSEVKLEHKNGSCIYVELTTAMITSEDEPAILIILRNITQRRQDEDQIRYLSFHDKLTGLYNRAFLEEEIKRIDTEEYLPISIIMGDLNGLKLVNDAFGHEKGDELLIAAAQAFRDLSRKEDITGRWGGDEYVCILPKVDEKTVEIICNRIKQACLETRDQPIHLSISLGMATKSQCSQNIYEVLKEAEDIMYKNKTMESKKVRNQISSTLQQVLHEKSYETKEHAQRMQEMARKIADHLSLTNNETYELCLLAMLHDIGKVAIPEALLNKPGKLTKEELKIVQGHCEIGYRIAASIPEISYIAEGILTHHERWDGSGYPRELKEVEIPFLSRIISIIDAYDVMVNGRIYKKMMSHEEALEELTRNAGTQFDPGLVSLFLSVPFLSVPSQIRQAR